MPQIIPIVYDHIDFVVVNKPCDIPMHDPVHGICQLLCRQLSIVHLYLVHRLDSGTSGCLLLAKNKHAAAILSQLFATKQIEKYYIAVSDSKPKKKQGKIAGDMKKSRGGSYMLTQPESSQPKAITFFISEGFHTLGRLFYIKPVSGKTHQIRVALKSIGSAILGDKRYKGSSSDRLYLHSIMLVFSYNQKDYCIQCMPQSGDFFSQYLLKDMRAIRELPWPKFTPPIAKLADTLKVNMGKPI
ncbi:MAG: tRNA pseudouridine32 synthase/23S rRNA pseudouridine746 synthase [Kangiellaceae bacterium]|jgi:tRNA pseudouridine32 synthase/23S rRNA pseudouridine746 synthase